MVPSRVHPLVRATWQVERARGRVRLPLPDWLRGVFFHARPFCSNLWGWVAQTLFSEPALRYRCRSVGRRLRLYRPAPQIMGDGTIDIGDDVEIAPGSCFLVGLGLPDPPTLRIGDDTHLGPQNILCVTRGLTIGAHCRTGPGVCIYDNDMHPLDPILRRAQVGNVPTVRSAPVTIEDDVWIGVHALVLKGVTIGRGAVVAAGAVVTDDVRAGSIVAGNPAREVGTVPGPAPAQVPDRP
jgi:carbonic anhydrase/acetyltransferase-like protein (isoleucine patch superfamily)